MKELKAYTVSFSGLKTGKHHFQYPIDKKFFDAYGYDDFLDINATVNLTLEKKETLLELSFSFRGRARLVCDTSNEPYDQPIEGNLEFVVKFGATYHEDDEIIIVPYEQSRINVAQYIYEMIVLSMPLKREHPGIAEETLESEILDRLEKLQPKTTIDAGEAIAKPQWDQLKKLITNKSLNNGTS